MKYAVLFEKTETGYSAYVPDLPGCIACGDSLEETEHLIKEAIELYIEALQESGQSVPEPTTRSGQIAVAV